MSDIGIRMGQGHWPDVAQQKLFSATTLVVVAAPHFALGPTRRLPVTAEDVVACPLISSPDTRRGPTARQAAQVAPPPADVAVVLSAIDSNIVIGAVLQGQGIALERREHWSRMYWRDAPWCRSPRSVCRTAFPTGSCGSDAKSLNAA